MGKSAKNQLSFERKALRVALGTYLEQIFMNDL